MIFTDDYYAMERDLSVLCSQITRNGMRMDVPAAQALLHMLEATSTQVAAELQIALPPIEEVTEFIPKRDNKTKGYITGQPFLKRKLVPFNPGSGPQFAARMIAQYGWQPTELTEGGEPSTTSKVLAKLPFPEAKLLLDYKIAAKRVTMLSGERGYLTMVDPDGYLRTEYFSLGTVTGRASHSPNIAQVPKLLTTKQGVQKGRAGHWGYEFRSLFSGPEGWWLVGADMKGLELRVFAHYLASRGGDGGEYGKLVCEGDPHSTNQDAAGLDSRDKAKTLIYAVLYGCGDKLAGNIADPEEREDFMLIAIGKMVKDGLIAGIPGFGTLLQWLKGLNSNALPGLDGRPLFARHAHTRLNTLLQGAGAILCKRWLLLVDAELQRIGLHHGDDYMICAWVHDEVQIAARTYDVAELVQHVCVAMAVQAGLYYDLLCPTAGSSSIGKNWAETH